MKRIFPRSADICPRAGYTRQNNETHKNNIECIGTIMIYKRRDLGVGNVLRFEILPRSPRRRR